MPNKWITFVKEWSAKNNMSYGCALSNSTMKTDYYKKHPNKKSNKAKEVQDTMGMSAEDKDAPAKPKPKPKKKKKLVLKQEVKPEPAVKKISAAKKVIDNFDLLKMISDFGVEREGYRGYKASVVDKMLKDPKIAHRRAAESLLEDALTEKYRYLRTLSTYSEYERQKEEEWRKKYLDKSQDEKDEMLRPYLLKLVHNHLDSAIIVKADSDKWKRFQAKFLTETKTVVEDDSQGASSTVQGPDNTVYRKIKNTWYVVGKYYSGDGAVDEPGGVSGYPVFFIVPKYKFVDRDGKDFTKSQRGQNEREGELDTVYERLAEMGGEAAQFAKDRGEKKALAEDTLYTKTKKVENVTRFKDNPSGKSFYKTPRGEPIYGKIDGKWYVVGEMDRGKGVFSVDKIAVPKYKFFNTKKENITDTAKNTE